MTKSDKASDKTEELKLCPFCGDLNLSVYEDTPETFTVYCEGCDTSGPIYGGRDSTQRHEAVELWNTRHSPVAPEDARQALEWFDEVVSLISQCMLHTTKDMDLSVEDLRHIETIRRALKELI